MKGIFLFALKKVYLKILFLVEGLVMHLEDKKIRLELLEHGHATIYKNEKLEDYDRFAIVKVTMDEKKGMVLKVYKQLHPVNSIYAIQENAVLSFISRGYIFIVHVYLKLLNNEHIQVLKIISTKKHRLREHFRVDVCIDYDINLYNDKGEPVDTIPVECDRISNLSGGGFFFYAFADLPENRLLHISLHLEDKGRIDLKAQTVRVRSLNKQKALFGVAVRFIDISNEDYESILNFLYSVQRKRLSEGTFKESKQYV